MHIKHLLCNNIHYNYVNGRLHGISVVSWNRGFYMTAYNQGFKTDDYMQYNEHGLFLYDIPANPCCDKLSMYDNHTICSVSSHDYEYTFFPSGVIRSISKFGLDKNRKYEITYTKYGKIKYVAIYKVTSEIRSKILSMIADIENITKQERLDVNLMFGVEI